MRLALLLALSAAVYGQPQPARASEYFEAFLENRFGVNEARFILNYPFQIADDKNGYCSAVMDHGGARYTFVLWSSASGKVFGFSEPSKRNENAMDASFWKYASGKWRELKDVLPPLDLSDFREEGSPLPAEMKRWVMFELTLPRTGTTIEARMQPICEKYDCRMGDHIVRDAKYSEIHLLWNSQTDRFLPGPKTAGKQ